MTNDLIFWYTGWTVWAIIGIIMLGATIIACTIGIAQVWHRSRAMLGMRILRAYVSDPERKRFKQWPTLPKDIPPASLFRWFIRIARQERKFGALKHPITVPAVTHEMIERAHRVYLDRDAVWKERQCSTGYDLAQVMLHEALQMPLPPERKFTRVGDDQ